ncbi:ATP synthase A1 subunit C [Candidatus Woesearchaeota archaeon]|nr:ATP synthase A1 subunit C [Candidatus Woesearchaeota archaeon]
MESLIKRAKNPKKIRLGFYPYTYVRTVVMRSFLFKMEDYHKMLKMGFNEIAKFLQDSYYQNEINELAREYSGANLLERALNKALENSFEKLIRISSEQLQVLIKEYLKRKDIEDIKTIIRGKFTNADEKAIISSLAAAGTLSREYLMSLTRKESIEKVLADSILKDNEITSFELLKDGLRELNEKNTLAGIENTLDRYYYEHLLDFSARLPKQGALFKDFLLNEIYILNLLTLFRMKRSNVDKKIIKSFLILSGDNLKDSKISSLAEIDNINELQKALEKTPYAEIIAKGIGEFKKNGSLMSLEIELYKYLLKKSILLLHQHPLTIDVILGYMFAKDIEVRNLKILVKGKQLGLSNDFIESQLVFWQ